MEVGAFAFYHSLADLGGYEAAVLVRYESPVRYYRLALSSLWKEVVLWRPSGGVLQVQEYPFETGKVYSVSVSCQGPRIVVSVDGKRLIDWWDTADPVLKGQVGVGRKEGESYVAALQVTALPRQKEAAPEHRAQFREATWHGYRFFFDGQEPVFLITANNVLDNMKFRPAYRPIFYAFNYITDWNRFSPTKAVESKTLETGERLVIDTTAVDPNKTNGITCATHLVVTYDRTNDVYVYDQDCTVDLPAAEAGQVGTAWDHGDAVFLGGVGHAQTRDPAALRALYQWSIFQGDDGKDYKVPFNHNGHYLSSATANGGPLKGDGGQWIVWGDPILSPVIQIRGLPKEYSKVGAGHCWWAYDMHTMFSPTLVDGKIQPGRYVSKVRYTGMAASEAKQRLDAAEFYKPVDTAVKIPVYAAGVGFTERFDKEVVLASPHQEHRLWAGVIDRTTGYDDTSSLRLDGPTEAWCITGSSYFMSAYGKRNLVTAWVKTKDVRGEGPTIGFRRWDTNEGSFYPSGITGTTNWTRIAFVTTQPIDHWGVTLFFRNSGTGTAWIDNVKIEPLPDGAVTNVPAGRLYPFGAAEPDVVLRWTDQGDSGSVLDLSGYGHHGKFYGQAAWVEDGGRRVIDVDGKASYIWPLCSPALTLAPPATMVLRLKPEAAGYLLFWGWNFNYHVTGNAPKFGIGYEVHGGKLVASQPFLEAGKWQTLAIVAADNRITLYCDGKLVETLQASLKGGDWGLHNNSTWHRHMSFFGGGPGDMTLTKDSAVGGMKGRLGGFRVYRRALADAEVQALSAPGASL